MALKELKNLSLLNQSEILKQINRLEDIKKKLIGKMYYGGLKQETITKIQENLEDIDEMISELKYDNQEYLKLFKFINKEMVN